ncbi:MAG: GNAT family N-acetyltransferase [Acidobacteriota bacterium]|nr:GNAT family N-acetyltransferase [Acidobacteriota bacterium]
MISVDRDIELRPVTRGDCEELYDAIDRNRARLREWLPWASRTFTKEELFDFLGQKEIENASLAGLTTHIRFDGKICGAVELHTINARHRNSSIGYWLDQAYEGRGIMTRACRAILTQGFGTYGLHRIEIRCGTENDKSCGVPRRLGFVEEGTLREAEWVFDRWVDLRVFSMLAQDWHGAVAQPETSSS